MDYTPTTEEVMRNDHILHATNAEEGLERAEEFDRWLAEVKAQAWEEGWKQGWIDYPDEPDPNPYRQGEK